MGGRARRQLEARNCLLQVEDEPALLANYYMLARQRQQRILGALLRVLFPYARANRSHQNAHYKQGDARKLPYPDNSFDAAISTLAIDVVPYAEEIVAEMSRVVRPGGILASALHEYRSAFAPTFILLDIAAVLDQEGKTLRDYMLPHPLVWPGGQASLWRMLGLADVREAPLVVSYDYISFDDYSGTWLAGQGRVGSYVVGLSEDARATLREHVRDAYLGGRPDGPRSFSVIHRGVWGINPA